ncbi:low temperature requirement protein A [Kitasatospora albolonga]
MRTVVERTGNSSPTARVGSVLAGNRVTTFELFFDLVYVFVLTKVTSAMAHEHDAVSVLRGLLLLALVWFSWSAYAWLGNQARADPGVVRAGMSLAMAGMFVVALAVPEAWHDAPDGLSGPVVLAAAYLSVRCVHLVLYSVLARGDQDLLRQVAISWGPVLAGAGLLVTGALIGGEVQTVFVAVAILVDWGGVYVTSRRGNWRIHDAGWFAERHELFMIIAIGESLLAMGAGAAEQSVTGPLLVAAVLGVAVALGLWWLYFDVAALHGEHRLRGAEDSERLGLAIRAYGYAHFPIVAGVVLTALGVEGVVAHAADGEALGGFYAAALCGGPALYLTGLVLFGRILHRSWSPVRLGALVPLLGWAPAAAALPPVAGLAGVAFLLAAVASAETRHYAELRRNLRPI